MISAMDERDILAQYREFGYAIVPQALSEEELTYLNNLVDKDIIEDPQSWHAPSAGAKGNGQILMKYPELDRFVRQRNTFPLLQEILMKEAVFSQFDFRDVPSDLANNSGLQWHRDMNISGDTENPYRTNYGCVIYYLKDVHDCCPCFTLVPNSHQHATMEEAKEKLGDKYEEVYVRGAAGTAILYDITMFHTRTTGQSHCTHGRRTMHNYQSRASHPPLVEWATVPEELALSEDPETKAFYSKWTKNQIKFASENYNNNSSRE